MAGLLDFFTGGDDPAKQRGLLDAAAALLQAGQPTRNPVSTFQALNNAQRAYLDGQEGYGQTQMKNQALAQALQLNGIKLKDAESDLANQDMLRARAKRIAERLAGGTQLPGAAPDAQQAPMASAMPGGAMSPKIGGPDWMQNFQQQAGGQMPGAQAPMPGGAAPRTSPIERRNLTQELLYKAANEAQIRSEEGDIDGANKAWERATKFLPEVHKIEVNLDGNNKPVNVITYKDGRQEVSQFGAKPDLTEVDLGDRKRFVDKNTTAPGTEFLKRQSPDSAAVDRRETAGGSNFDLSESTVDAIGQGRMQPPTGYALRNPKIANLMDRVAAKYPEFDATEYAGKAKAMRDFTTGKQGDSIRSFAVASDHLTQLKGLITALDNGNTPLVNKYANIVAQQTGSVAPTNFDAAKGIVAKEVLKSIVAGGGGVEERQELAHLLDNAKTGKQLGGVVDTYLHLMGAQRDGLMRQYELSTGRKDGAQRFNYQQGGGDAGAAPKPQAKVDMLPNAAQAAGRRYRADNGTIYRSDGTKWIKE